MPERSASEPSGSHGTRWALGAGVLIVVAVLLVTACGATHRPTTSVRKSAPVLTDAAVLFMAHSGVDDSDTPALFTAQQVLLTRCMRRRGFRYAPAQLSRSPAVFAAISLYTASGLPPLESNSLRARGRWGYGIADLNLAAKQPAPRGSFDADRYFRSLPPAKAIAFVAALRGNTQNHGTLKLPSGSVETYTTGGCLAAAQRMIYGSPRIADSIVAVPQDIFGELAAKTKANNAVRVATAAWSRCIAHVTGRRFSSPNAAAASIAALYSLSGVTTVNRAREVRMSLIDGRCQYASGLARVYSATFRRLAAHLPGALASAIVIALSQERRSASRARKILRDCQGGC